MDPNTPVYDDQYSFGERQLQELQQHYRAGTHDLAIREMQRSSYEVKRLPYF